MLKTLVRNNENYWTLQIVVFQRVNKNLSAILRDVTCNTNDSKLNQINEILIDATRFNYGNIYFDHFNHPEISLAPNLTITLKSLHSLQFECESLSGEIDK